jgi:hypothetical protein
LGIVLGENDYIISRIREWRNVWHSQTIVALPNECFFSKKKESYGLRSYSGIHCCGLAPVLIWGGLVIA